MKVFISLLFFFSVNCYAAFELSYSVAGKIMERITIKEKINETYLSTNSWIGQSLDSRESTVLGVFLLDKKNISFEINALKGYLKRLKQRKKAKGIGHKALAHSAQIAINGQFIDSQNLYFKNIEKLIFSLVKSEKKCVKCAKYQRVKGQIYRIENSSKKLIPNENCQKTKHYFDCIDSDFGNFKLARKEKISRP